MNKIFVIGDSHSQFFSGNETIGGSPIFFNGKPTGINSPNPLIYNFLPFHLGPALAYNLSRYGSKTLAREKIEFLLNSKIIPEGEIILCCFGEIDMRVHSIRQAVTQKIPVETVVDSIIENYLAFLKFLTQKNIVYVWGAIPTQKDDSPINPEYPYFGKEIERNQATAYFNAKLKFLCENNGIKFLSIFQNLIDKNFKTRNEFIADGCHLSQRAWLFATDEFKRQGIQIIFSDDWVKNICVRLLQHEAKGGGGLTSSCCINFFCRLADFFCPKFLF